MFDRDASRVRRDRRQPAVRWADGTSRPIRARRTSEWLRAAATRLVTAAPTWSRTSSAAASSSCAPTGTFGLIATNTIGQGDTRASGLRVDLHPWRGDLRGRASGSNGRDDAAVIVSVVHIVKGEFVGPAVCSTAVPSTRSRAYLFHAGGHESRRETGRRTPARASRAASSSGLGFTFDDTDTKGIASPIADMERLIAADPTERGSDLPVHRRRGGERQIPLQAPHRYVIDFGDGTRRSAGDGGPSCMAIVEEKVKPERDARRMTNKYPVWQRRGGSIRNSSPGAIRAAIADLDRVLVTLITQRSRRSSRLTFLPSGCVYSEAARRLPLRDTLPHSPRSSRAPRALGAVLRLIDEGRPPLHPIRLLRDVPVPRRLGDGPRHSRPPARRTTTSAPR